MGTEFLFWGDENILELNSGDVLKVNVLNATELTVHSKIVNFMLCIFYHYLKKI